MGLAAAHRIFWSASVWLLVVLPMIPFAAVHKSPSNKTENRRARSLDCGGHQFSGNLAEIRWLITPLVTAVAHNSLRKAKSRNT
jgi:hypothetical protein